MGTFLPTKAPGPYWTPTPNLTATQRAAEFSIPALDIQATASSAASQWKVILSDSFDNNNNEWKTGVREDDLATLISEINNGKYTLNATAKSGFVEGVASPKIYSVKDFIATLECKVNNLPTAEYGIVFRKDILGNYYFFRLSDTGYFKLSLRRKEEWITIINWTQSPLIKTGGTNRITVIGQGSQFLFFINDTYAAQAVDDTIASGHITMAVSLDKGEQATFEFDNFEIRAP